MSMSTVHADSEKQGDGTERCHIALIGFMGAGKTTVGRALAQAVGMEFVDLDEVIVKAARKSVAEIFREHGEVAFRARERAAVREVLASPTPTVIATGGGTYADPANRLSINRAARTVYLRATVDHIMERLGTPQARGLRPLLSGPDPLATVLRLLELRLPAYESCAFTVPTDDRTPDEVVLDIIQVLRLDRGGLRRTALQARRAARSGSVPTAGPLMHVQAGLGAYPIELRPHAGAWLAQAIVASHPAATRWAVISDTQVAPLHAPALVASLTALGKTVTLHTFAAGETSKVLATAAHLYEALLDAELGRQDGLVALGGGVVGDLTGFVASTFLRGIAFVQVPTTTLAAVDSSVGGKTGVNTAHGKNLVGTFYPPKAVLIAGAHLQTQSPRQHAAGLVEALKMAAALDASLFHDMVRDAAALLGQDADTTLGVIARAVALKADVVSRDELETGERAVLNYGHTLGHAIETGEAYRLLHGEAVALGMVAEALWADTEGLSKDMSQTLAAALSALGVPTEWRQCTIDSAALGADKKRLGAGVRLPVVRELGSFELRTVPLSALVEYVARRKTPS